LQLQLGNHTMVARPAAPPPSCLINVLLLIIANLESEQEVIDPNTGDGDACAVRRNHYLINAIRYIDGNRSSTTADSQRYLVFMMMTFNQYRFIAPGSSETDDAVQPHRADGHIRILQTPRHIELQQPYPCHTIFQAMP